MSRFKVEEVCFDLGNEVNVMRFKEDLDGFLAHYSLTESEKESIKKGDIGALYKTGVLTQALACLSRALGHDNATHVRKLRAAVGLPEIPEQIDILKRR